MLRRDFLSVACALPAFSAVFSALLGDVPVLSVHGCGDFRPSFEMVDVWRRTGHIDVDWIQSVDGRCRVRWRDGPDGNWRVSDLRSV